VNPICAATFIAAIGQPSRFLTSRNLVAYLGLDPKVRQSGEAPARSGRISKRGSASARWALVEAAWSVVLQPGPLHAFYQRTRGRRGHGKAIVATARKLAILFWCMLTRGEDYARQQPSLTKRKLRQLELKAGAPKNTKSARGIWSSNDAVRQQSASSPSKPNCHTSEWSKASKRELRREEQWARARHRSAHKLGPRRAKPRGRLRAPDVCTYGVHPATRTREQDQARKVRSHQSLNRSQLTGQKLSKADRRSSVADGLQFRAPLSSPFASYRSRGLARTTAPAGFCFSGSARRRADTSFRDLVWERSS
jgi:hypothetical protein